MKLYHVAHDRFDGLLSTDYSRDNTDFGKRIYFSFDELSAAQYNLDRLQHRGSVLCVDVPSEIMTQSEYHGLYIYHFGLDFNTMSDENKSLLAATFVNYRERSMFPEFADKYDILIGLRADSPVIANCDAYVENYGFDFSNISVINNFLHILRVTEYDPQIAFNQKAIDTLLNDASAYIWL